VVQQGLVERITAWEPGARLAWKSMVDDVEVAVSFEATAAGTDVTVQATLPDGGADRGGTAWVRVSRNGSRLGAPGANQRPDPSVSSPGLRWASITPSLPRRPDGWPLYSGWNLLLSARARGSLGGGGRTPVDRIPSG
jgi:hypothetical protein